MRSKSIHGSCFWVAAVGKFYDPLCTTFIFYCFTRKTNGHISIFSLFFCVPRQREKNHNFHKPNFLFFV